MVLFVNQERWDSVLAPCEKTACKQVLFVDEFLWRFFRIGVLPKKIIEVGNKEGIISCFFNNQIRAVGFASLSSLMFHYGIGNYFLFTKPCGVFRSACCSTQKWVGQTTPLRGGVEAVRHGCRCILKKMQTWMFAFFLFLTADDQREEAVPPL